MLFSDKKLADFINKNFEPCWESLRPVPILTVDFGNGNTLRRTLHGNVASYICLADGQVVDVLPGVYGPRTYQHCLEKLAAVTRFVRQVPDSKDALADYHTGRSQFSLAPLLHVPEPEILVLGGNDFSKNMRADNDDNETYKRAIIHKLLGARSRTQPPDITKQVYKKTLAVDLDDPYLGLGKALSCKFPGEPDQ